MPLAISLILTTTSGCSNNKILHTVKTAGFTRQDTKGELTPWEKDFQAHPENYEGMSTNPPEDLKVLHQFYLDRGVEIVSTYHQQTSPQCPADTCPRDYLTIARTFPQNTPNLGSRWMGKNRLNNSLFQSRQNILRTNLTIFHITRNCLTSSSVSVTCF